MIPKVPYLSIAWGCVDGALLADELRTEYLQIVAGRPWANVCDALKVNAPIQPVTGFMDYSTFNT